MPLRGHTQPAHIDITAELRLRSADRRDAALALPWYQDAEVLKGSEGSGLLPYDLAIVEKMYSILSTDGELYLIEVWHESQWHPIGDIALKRHTLPIVIGSENYRGKGVASAVLEAIEARARLVGFEKLHVARVFRSNQRSLRFFLRHGFFVVAEDGEGFSLAKNLWEP